MPLFLRNDELGITIELTNTRKLGRAKLQCSCSSISRTHGEINVTNDCTTIKCKHHNGIVVDIGSKMVQLQAEQKFLLKTGHKIRFGFDEDDNKWFTVTNVDSSTDRPLGRGLKRKCKGETVKPATDEATKTSSATVNKENAEERRKSCILGLLCGFKLPQHFIELAHPGDEDFDVVRYKKPKPNVPKCQYGKKCYRVNIDHWENFTH